MRIVPVVAALMLASVLVVSAASAQGACPLSSERAQRSVQNLLWHPFIAEEPLFDDTAYSRQVMPLVAEERRRIDLIGLEPQEVRALKSEADEAICAELLEWAKAQPGVGPQSRFGFFGARERFIVIAWIEDPGRIRLGRFEDTFAAFFNGDLELIEKHHW